MGRELAIILAAGGLDIFNDHFVAHTDHIPHFGPTLDGLCKGMEEIGSEKRVNMGKLDISMWLFVWCVVMTAFLIDGMCLRVF